MLRTRRARLSMTSLIDVIFLLLLFFMLTSTFSRFGEIPITLGGAGQNTSGDVEHVLLRISEDGMRLNGQSIVAEDLAKAIVALSDAPQVLLTATDAATAQNLADVLYKLRQVPNAQIVVLQ